MRKPFGSFRNGQHIRNCDNAIGLALYFRMHELEERVDQFSSPSTAFFSAEQNGLSDGRIGM